MIDGDVAFQRDDGEYHHRADVVEALDEVQQLAHHLHTKHTTV